MMKKKWIIGCLLFQAIVVCAQPDIDALEYFIDVDPGVGNATAIPVTPGNPVSVNINIPTASLSDGVHILFIRARDTNGEWSFYESRAFLIQQLPPATPSPSDVMEIEYFIDTDPGQGNATASASFSPGLTVNLNEMISTAPLSEGLHVLGVRARDADGDWGMVEKRPFLITQSGVIGPPPPSSVEEIEYLIDADPGHGNATATSAFSPGLSINLDEIVATSALPVGIHTISVRARNQDNEWGVYETRPFVVIADPSSSPVADVTKLEYFFNDDPGIGNGMDIPITPGQTIDLPSIDLSHPAPLPVGMNSVTVRAQNAIGIWGVGELREFDVVDDCMQPVSDFSVQLDCASETVNFIDNSTGVQPDAEYRWYFDGDDVPDSFTVGSTSFVFDQPGDFTVALAIRQGMICFDSLGINITIEPKPIAVFNADPVELGTPTLFEVTQFNVSPTAAWSWDFENDGIVDDNTAGNTTFTYPTTGDFTANLTVDNGNGCQNTFSDMVSITLGGGGGTPIANFIVETVCEGQVTVFTDISTDIPGSATYSWDFDNDGVEDDNTRGSTLFTYPADGDFTAVLEIDLGGTIIMHNETVTVNPIPVADFTAPPVCLGDPTLFTDISTDVKAGATYSWDFNGDGLEDATGLGNKSFIYDTAGTFDASLTLDNGSGCQSTFMQAVIIKDEPQVDFAIDASCFGLPTDFIDNSTDVAVDASYAWDFDSDGSIDDTSEGSTTFTFTSDENFTTSLTIDNGSGCTVTSSQPVIFEDAPEADFTALEVCLGEATIFTDLSLQAGMGTAYSWDFDGDAAEDSAVPGSTSFTYDSPGTFQVTLNLDKDGCKDSKSTEIVVKPLPEVSLGEDLTICPGESVVLDPGPEFFSYMWTDGSNNQTITVSQPGSFRVQVTDTAQCSNADTVRVFVSEAPQAIYDFTLEIFELFVTARFENNSLNADQFIWDFGDGTTSNESAPTHDYNDIDIFEGSVFEVCLTAINGCTENTICQEVFLSITATLNPGSGEGILIYPNPHQGTFTVRFNSKANQETRLQLINSRGKLVWSKIVDPSQLNWEGMVDISAQGKGLYILQIVNGDILKVKKTLHK